MKFIYARIPQFRICILLMLLSAVCSQVQAAITAINPFPKQSQVVANSSNTIRVNWRIATSADHTAGTSSAVAELVDPSGRLRATVPVAGTLTAGGPGPYSLNETIQISAADLQRFQEQGIRRILLRRTFIDPSVARVPVSINAGIALTLAGSRLSAGRDGDTGSLSINRLSLSFTDNQVVKLVDPGEVLVAQLTVNYSGSGLLQGRWQVSEPGSSAGRNIYRTMSPVRKQLNRSQRAVIHSPELLTDVPGKFRLRFCVTNPEFIDRTRAPDDSACPNPDLAIAIAYQVSADRGSDVARLVTLSPTSGQVDPGTVFSWSPATGAALYQLQIFSPNPEPGADPDFVTGMLIPSSDASVLLSSLVMSKLLKGHRYLWRVTAHNQDGVLVARSPIQPFILHE